MTYDQAYVRFNMLRQQMNRQLRTAEGALNPNYEASSNYASESAAQPYYQDRRAEDSGEGGQAAAAANPSVYNFS